ncbi:hypothetical protein [Acetobacterium carbinolicum]
MAEAIQILLSDYLLGNMPRIQKNGKVAVLLLYRFLNLPESDRY